MANFRALLIGMLALASPAFAAGPNVKVVVVTASKNGNSIDYALKVTNNGPKEIATLTIKCVLFDRRGGRIKDDFAVFDNLKPGQTQSGSSMAETSARQIARFDHLACSVP